MFKGRERSSYEQKVTRPTHTEIVVTPLFSEQAGVTCDIYAPITMGVWDEMEKKCYGHFYIRHRGGQGGEDGTRYSIIFKDKAELIEYLQNMTFHFQLTVAPYDEAKVDLLFKRSLLHKNVDAGLFDNATLQS